MDEPHNPHLNQIASVSGKHPQDCVVTGYQEGGGRDRECLCAIAVLE